MNFPAGSIRYLLLSKAWCLPSSGAGFRGEIEEELSYSINSSILVPSFGIREIITKLHFNLCGAAQVKESAQSDQEQWNAPRARWQEITRLYPLRKRRGNNDNWKTSKEPVRRQERFLERGIRGGN